MAKFKDKYFIVSAFLLFMFLYAPTAMSFTLTEKLQYDLIWTGIKAGDAALEMRDNGSHIQFISTANSAKWVSVFYHVEDMAVSILKKEPYNSFAATPQNYRLTIREGKHRRDKELIFYHSVRKVTYINHLKNETKDFDISNSTFDPLSSLYYIRDLSLEVGKSVFVDIFDSKKLYKAEVEVLKKETIKTPAGTFKTILIRPIMQTEGIFSRKGDMLIWLSDDEKKIPVMLKTKVPVGSVKAILVKIQ
jgi:hypothetical protein